MKIRKYAFDEDGFMRLQKDIDALINETNLTHQHISHLYTDYCDIRSEDGLTKINGRLFQQYDNSNNLRLQMGYNSTAGTYDFNLYNAAGTPTVYINSSGEAVFADKIQTLKDAYVGNNIYIGAADTVDNKGVYFYNPGLSAYDNIGMFLAETDPGSYHLYIGNQNATVEIFSATEIFLGDRGSLVGLSIDLEHGNFSMFTASTEDSHIKHGGSGRLWLQHEGTGVIKIECLEDISITPGSTKIVYLDGSVKIGDSITSKVGFWGTNPQSKTSVSDLSSWSNISAGTDSVSLADLNTKVSAIHNKVNSLLNALQSYGLV